MILIVDDDPINRILLHEILVQENFSTIQAEDGYVAIEKAHTKKVNLILLDIMMPGLGGLETLALLKEDPKTRDIPVIIVTAVDTKEEFKKAFELGAIDYLNKPIKQFDLVIKVKNYLKLAKKELELKKSELRYKSIIEDQTEFIIRYLADGTISFVNKAFCRYLHKDRDELIGINIAENVIFPDGYKVFRDLKSLDKGLSISRTVRSIYFPPGRVKWQEWVERVLFDDNKQVLEYQCVGRDITVQKGYEEAIRIITDETAGVTGDGFFHSLLKNLVNMLHARCAVIGRYIVEEKKWVINFRECEKECDDCLTSPVIPADWHNEIINTINSAKTGGTSKDNELILKSYSDEGDVAGIPLYDSHKQPLGILVVMSPRDFVLPYYVYDIIRLFSMRASAELERSLANKKLMESELKFRNIFHSSNDIIVISDFDHNILETNQPFFSLFHSSGNDFSHICLSNLIHPNDVENFLNSVDELKNTRNKSYFLEVKVRLPNNKVRMMEINGKTILYKDQKAVLSIFRDITERKQVHLKVLNAVIQTEEKERRRYAQDLHDGLGPILSTIKLYAKSVLTARDEKTKTVAVEKSLETVDEAIATIRQIANNISPNILRDFGLDVAVKSYVTKFNDTRKINIYFRSELKNRFNPDIESSLFRIIIELINNTIKYAGANNVIIGLYQTEKELKLQYSDDGIGFNLKSVMARSTGNGLQNIMHRADSLNGEMKIGTDIDKGFNLEISFSNISINLN